MKKLLLASMLLVSLMATAQTVSVPADELTEQQKQKFLHKDNIPTVETAHQWVGLGKEVGEAFNGAMGAFTDQADRFSKTNVGKFAMVVVAYKVIGSDALHFLAGTIELIAFVPIFLWSYRRSCMDKRVILTSEGSFWNRKKTYKLLEYSPDGEFTPRHGHSLVLAVFAIIWLATTFAG